MGSANEPKTNSMEKSVQVFYQTTSERIVWCQNYHGVRPCKQILHDGGHVKQLLGKRESYKINTIDAKLERHDNLSRAISKSTSIKYGKVLQEIEMKQLLMALFDCENPLYTANGKSIMMEIENSEIEKFFKK